jgi:hypothetical protein
MRDKMKWIGFIVPLIFLTATLWAAEPDITHRTSTIIKPSLTTEPETSPNAKPAATIRRPPGKSDLIITNVQISPANPEPGDIVHFRALVTNNGSEPAPASKGGVRVGGETNPVLYNMPSIPVKKSIKLIRNLRMDQEGKFIVKFIADAKNDVRESNEKNNLAQKTFTVAVAPFVIAEESMHTYCFPNSRNFTFYVRPSKPVDTSTVNNSVIQVRVRRFVNEQLSSEELLTGSITRRSFMEWKSGPTDYACACTENNQTYCLVDMTLQDTLRAQDGSRLDGNRDGRPGGDYHHQFRRGMR